VLLRSRDSTAGLQPGLEARGPLAYLCRCRTSCHTSGDPVPRSLAATAPIALVADIARTQNTRLWSGEEACRDGPGLVRPQSGAGSEATSGRVLVGKGVYKQSRWPKPVRVTQAEMVAKASPCVRDAQVRKGGRVWSDAGRADVWSEARRWAKPIRM
jgi:hypothetical protein